MSAVYVQQLTDSDLLRMYVNDNNHNAMDQLIRRLFNSALRIAFSTVGPDLAADAVQDAFLNLLRSAERFDFERDFSVWWHGILFNSLKKRQRTEYNYQRKVDRFISGYAPDNNQHEQSLEINEVFEHVNRLPPDLQNAIQLRFYGGHSHAEIATILNIPHGTASSRIRRGLDSLRKSLKVSAGSAAAILLALGAIQEAFAEELERLLAQVAPTTATLLQRLKQSSASSSSGGLVTTASKVLGLGLVIAIFGLMFLIAAPERQKKRSTLPTKIQSASSFNASFDKSSLTMPAALATQASGPDIDRVSEAQTTNQTSKSEDEDADCHVFRVVTTRGLPASNAQWFIAETGIDRQKLTTVANGHSMQMPWHTHSLALADETGQISIPKTSTGSLYVRWNHQTVVYDLDSSQPSQSETPQVLELRHPVLQEPYKTAHVQFVGTQLPQHTPFRFIQVDFEGAQLPLPAWWNSWTDDQNRGLIHNLVPGKYKLWIEIPGQAPVVAKLQLSSKSSFANTVTTVKLQPAIELSGRVFLTAGASEIAEKIELDDLDVFAVVEEAKGRTRVSAKITKLDIPGINEFEYRFTHLNPDLNYRIHARAPGFTLSVPFRFANEDRQQSTSQGPDLALGSGSKLRGRIVDLAGKPICDRAIVVSRTKAIQDDRGWVTHSDSEGKFQFTGLSYGNWYIAVRPFDYETYKKHADAQFYPHNLRRRSVKINAPTTDLGDVVSTIRPHCILTGKVLTPEGTIAENARITCVSQKRKYVGFSDETGHYELILPQAKRALLVAQTPEHAEGRTITTRLAKVAVDLVLNNQSAQVHGKITSQANSTHRTNVVTLRSILVNSLKTQHLTQITAIGPNGEFAFHGLVPGRYTLNWPTGIIQPLTIESGQRLTVQQDLKDFTNQLNITANTTQRRFKPHGVQIDWTTAQGYKGMRYQGLSKGETLFENLPDGEYQVSFTYLDGNHWLSAVENVTLSGGEDRIIQAPLAPLGPVSLEGPVMDTRRAAIVAQNGRWTFLRFVGRHKRFKFDSLSQDQWRIGWSTKFGFEYLTGRKLQKFTTVDLTSGAEISDFKTDSIEEDR